MTIEQKNAYTVEAMAEKLAFMRRLLSGWEAEDAEKKAKAAEDPKYKESDREMDACAALIHNGFRIALEDMELTLKSYQSLEVTE